MAKYYVRSGQLEKIVIADNEVDAAYRALLLCSGEEIDKYFYVDQRGFRGPCPHNHNSVDTNAIPSHSIKYEDMCEEKGEN